MTTEAEIRVMQPQAKEYQELTQTPEGGREAWNRFSLTASGVTSPAHTSLLDFWPPEL